MIDLIRQIAGDLPRQNEGFEPEPSIMDIGTMDVARRYCQVKNFFSGQDDSI